MPAAEVAPSGVFQRSILTTSASLVPFITAAISPEILALWRDMQFRQGIGGHAVDLRHRSGAIPLTGHKRSALRRGATRNRSSRW